VVRTQEAQLRSTRLQELESWGCALAAKEKLQVRVVVEKSQSWAQSRVRVNARGDFNIILFLMKFFFFFLKCSKKKSEISAMTKWLMK